MATDLNLLIASSDDMASIAEHVQRLLPGPLVPREGDEIYYRHSNDEVEIMLFTSEFVDDGELTLSAYQYFVSIQARLRGSTEAQRASTRLRYAQQLFLGLSRSTDYDLLLLENVQTVIATHSAVPGSQPASTS